MSRVEQTETEINSHWRDGWEGKAKHIHHVARALAAEVDELRAKLDQVRSEIGCARGQRTTQFCAEAVEIKRRLDAVVKMLEPLEVGVCPDCGGSGDFFVNALPPKGIVPTGSGYKIACETCGGHEDGRGSGVITFPDTSLHARVAAIAEGRDNG